MASKRKSTDADDKAFNDLGEVFNFTAADLKANQDGRLSARQIELLRNMGKKNIRYSAFGIKLMAVFMLVAGGIIYIMLASSSAFESSDRLIFLAVLPLPILVLAGYYFFTKKQRVKYENPKLQMSEGLAKIKSKGSKYGTYMDVVIGSFHTHLMDEHAARIEHGKPYRVYYVQISKLPGLLSIEQAG